MTVMNDTASELPVGNLLVDIDVRAQAWQQTTNIAATTEASLNAAWRAAGFEAGAEVSVVLADDDFVHTLNRDYRAKDRPTNVLSFPQLDASFDPDEPHGEEPLMLGDIVIAHGVVEAEAHIQGKTFSDHFGHLCVHGMLHLLGYDHESVEEAAEMESLEVNILRKLGINDPYDDRTSDKAS